VTRRRQHIPALDDKLIDVVERLGHVMRVQLRAVAAESGLSPMQAELLIRLRDRTREAEVGRLAAWLDVRTPTVSDSVATLERKGLLTRRASDADRRRHSLQLTRRGRSVADRLAEWDTPMRVALAGLEGRDDLGPKAAMYELLVALVARLHQAGFVTVARTCGTCRFFRPDRHVGSERRHHCALLDLPLGGENLRLDCPEHEPAA
jgi:DNA-binding MarR family transcriptional regulator